LTTFTAYQDQLPPPIQEDNEEIKEDQANETEEDGQVQQSEQQLVVPPPAPVDENLQIGWCALIWSPQLLIKCNGADAYRRRLQNDIVYNDFSNAMGAGMDAALNGSHFVNRWFNGKTIKNQFQFTVHAEPPTGNCNASKFKHLGVDSKEYGSKKAAFVNNQRAGLLKTCEYVAELMHGGIVISVLDTEQMARGKPRECKVHYFGSVQKVCAKDTESDPDPIKAEIESLFEKAVKRQIKGMKNNEKKIESLNNNKKNMKVLKEKERKKEITTAEYNQQCTLLLEGLHADSESEGANDMDIDDGFGGYNEDDSEDSD